MGGPPVPAFAPAPKGFEASPETMVDEVYGMVALRIIETAIGS